MPITFPEPLKLDPRADLIVDLAQLIEDAHSDRLAISVHEVAEMIVEKMLGERGNPMPVYVRTALTKTTTGSPADTGVLIVREEDGAIAYHLRAKTSEGDDRRVTLSGVTADDDQPKIRSAIEAVRAALAASVRNGIMPAAVRGYQRHETI